MPEDKKTVDIDTSGPGAEIDVAEEKVKEEGVVETEATEQEPETKEEETTQTVKEIKKEQKKDDEQLEEYSKGVQSRISNLPVRCAKLKDSVTRLRNMRERLTKVVKR